MELKFSITSDQLRKLSTRLNSERIAKNDHLAAQLNVLTTRTLMLWFPLLAPAVFYHVFWGSKKPEPYIAIVICAILYLLLWKTSIKKRIKYKPLKPSKKMNTPDPLIEKATARRLATLEGDYKATITNKTLQLITPDSKRITIAWRNVFYFDEDSDFYYLTTKRRLPFKTTYLISKNGDMSDTRNQTKLEELFSRLNIHKNKSNKSRKINKHT